MLDCVADSLGDLLLLEESVSEFVFDSDVEAVFVRVEDSVVGGVVVEDSV